MADLSSSSSISTIRAAYDDNALYDVDNSTSKARLFIQACRYLINRLSSDISQGGDSVRNQIAVYERQLSAAQAWLASNSTTTTTGAGGVKFLSMEHFSR